MMGHTPLVPMQKQSNSVDPPTSIDGSPVHREVLIQGKILLERTAFLGHSFVDDDAELIGYLKDLLSELFVKVLTGERAEANSVSQKVKDRIAQSEIFVGVLTRRERIGDTDKWRSSEWVLEERTHAAALGKRVILLKELGVELKGGLQGDSEYIEFDRAQLHRAALKLIQMILSLNPGKMAINRDGPMHLSLDILEAAVAAQPREPMLRVQLAQARARIGQAEAAMRELSETVRAFPDFTPARHELIKGLRTLGRKDDVERECGQLLEKDPHDATAHHQLAHVFDDRKEYQAAEAEFLAAQDCAPGDPSNFVCHAKMIFRNAGSDRAELRRARELFTAAISLGGPNIEKQNAGFLSGIQRKLKQIPPERSRHEANERRRKKRKQSRR